VSRELALSVTIHDCEVQTFRAGGKGGQNQNKRDTGVRVIHHPSGAIGEAREERSQLQNKQSAFRKMATSTKFTLWVKRQCANEDLIKAQVERDMWPVNIKTEVQQDGTWVETREV
jgi:protein subunit release factor B